MHQIVVSESSSYRYRENSVSAKQTAVIDVQEVCPLESHLSVPDASDINPLCHSDEMAQENHTAISPLHAVSNALPHDLIYHNLIDVKREGVTWIKLGSSRSYVPSSDDVGLTLKLECLPVDHSTGVHLSPAFVILTNPVIIFPAPCPRCMISVGSGRRSECSSSEPQSTNGINFTVLSYNILADLYASRNAHQSTPAWALTWEYRSQNLLNEIIGYNSDIICLQEVGLSSFINV